MMTAPNPENPLVVVPVRMGEHVFKDLAADLQRQEIKQVLLVADENTYPACGRQVEEAVKEAGLPGKKIILRGQPWVAADETSVAQVLQALGGQEHILAAVGSGTVTDIVRFVAFQTRLPFISIPSAASVDAYTSITAAITLQQVKQTFITQTAQSVYAHLPTLCAAPPRLTAAGFSDMIAKQTALADWQLAHLLTGDAYHAGVAQQARDAIQTCTSNARAIRLAEPAGIAALFEGLSISGRCMVTVHSSRPAAGAEHSLAHFWEILHQQQHLPASLHGEKTGVASVIIARVYENLRHLTRQEAARQLGNFKLRDPQYIASRLRDTLGPAAEFLIENRPSFLGDLRGKIDLVKTNVLAHWERLQEIASTVPTAEEIAVSLKLAGALSEPAQIHIQDWEVAQALENALYVRNRFTILELSQMLGLVS